MFAWLAPSQDGSAVPLWASLVMLGMGLALAAFVAVHVARSRKVPPSRSAPATPRQADAPTSAPTPQLARELDELCRRVADELDQRAERLEKLIAVADQRLARLERVTSGGLTTIPDPLSVLTEPKPIAAPPVHDGDPLAGEVYRLSDSGLPPIQIAQRLGQHTGKVELILALRRA